MNDTTPLDPLAEGEYPLAADEQVLTVSEVSQILRVSVSWVRREAINGRLPSVRFGGNRRFLRSAIAEYVSNLRPNLRRANLP